MPSSSLVAILKRKASVTIPDLESARCWLNNISRSRFTACKTAPSRSPRLHAGHGQHGEEPVASPRAPQALPRQPRVCPSLRLCPLSQEPSENGRSPHKPKVRSFVRRDLNGRMLTGPENAPRASLPAPGGISRRGNWLGQAPSGSGPSHSTAECQALPEAVQSSSGWDSCPSVTESSFQRRPWSRWANLTPAPWC